MLSIVQSAANQQRDSFAGSKFALDAGHCDDVVYARPRAGYSRQECNVLTSLPEAWLLQVRTMQCKLGDFMVAILATSPAPRSTPNSNWLWARRCGHLYLRRRRYWLSDGAPVLSSNVRRCMSPRYPSPNHPDIRHRNRCRRSPVTYRRGVAALLPNPTVLIPAPVIKHSIAMLSHYTPLPKVKPHRRRPAGQ